LHSYELNHKTCGKISRRIEGSQLDLDQAPGIGQNDDVIEQQSIAAVHESAVGTSRHFAARQRFGRFRREADINW